MSLLYVLMYTAGAGNREDRRQLPEVHHHPGGAQEQRFVGGSQVVARRSRRRSGSRVVLGAPVRRIAQSAGGVRVVADGITVDARSVIVAVPPVLAKDIVFAPGLPGGQARDPARVRARRADEVRGDLRDAVLARGRPQRPGRERRRAHEHDLRQQPAGR